MTTKYPADLPDVPADRWGAKIENVLNATTDDGLNAPIVTWSVPADTQDEAERRALAVQHFDYQDDLEGARAEGTVFAVVPNTSVWFVSIIFKPYL